MPILKKKDSKNEPLIESRICTFCRLPIKIYNKKDLSLVETFLALVLFGFLSSLVWSQFLWKGFFFSLLGLTLMQGFVKLRWRARMSCKHCGFDPIAYMRDPEVAANRVNAFMERRRGNPAYILRAKPNIPVKVKKVKVSASHQLLLTKEEKSKLESANP